MSATTPIPWTLNKDLVVTGPIGDRIADFNASTGKTHAEKEANAKLFLAAPGLLHALEIAATTLETVYRERDPKNLAAKNAAQMAREAIAKAHA